LIPAFLASARVNGRRRNASGILSRRPIETERERVTRYCQPCLLRAAAAPFGPSRPNCGRKIGAFDAKRPRPVAGGPVGKKKEPLALRGSLRFFFPGYIMSGDMPPGIPEFLFSSGTSVTIASVVSTMAAIDAAFCSADRVTLAGSTIPASNMFTNLSLRAS
jgi:hypothetical protein